MSETEITRTLPVSSFKDFDFSGGPTVATRAKATFQTFRANRRMDGTVYVEVADGESIAVLVVSPDDARRFGDMLHKAAEG